MMDEDDTDWREEYIYLYVKSLMVTVENDDENESTTLKQKVRSKLYTVSPGFKYSTRIVAATVVSTIAVYIMFILGMLVGILVFDKFWDIIFTGSLINSLSEVTGYPIDEIKYYGTCVIISWWLGLVFALIFFVLVLMNSLTWYRRHILKLRKGDRSFLPNSIDKGSLDAGTLMTASMKFAGYQIGYSVWGFIVMGGIAFIAFIVLSTQFILPMKTNRLSTLLILLIKLWPTILIGIVIATLQKIAARLFFLIDKDTLAVNNRQAFHITSYFMFYFNIFLGLVSCLIRIVFGMIAGVLFLQRLQKSSLPRSYEKRDPGYLTYLGYLLLENQHANPVLQCFVRLLLETQGKQLHDEYTTGLKKRNVKVTIATDSMFGFKLEDNINQEKEKKSYHQKRAENRWYLFILLAQNPSLIKYRKRHMQETKSKVLSKALLNFTFNVSDENDVLNKNNEKQPLTFAEAETPTDSVLNEDKVNSESFNQTPNGTVMKVKDKDNQHYEEAHQKQEVSTVSTNNMENNTVTNKGNENRTESKRFIEDNIDNNDGDEEIASYKNLSFSADVDSTESDNIHQGNTDVDSKESDNKIPIIHHVNNNLSNRPPENNYLTKVEVTDNACDDTCL